MKRRLLVGIICLLLGSAGAAWAAAPTPTVKGRPAAMDSDEAEHHTLVQRFYHDRFFGEPWRLYGYYHIIERETGVLLVLDVVLGVTLWRWSARRTARRPKL